MESASKGAAALAAKDHAAAIAHYTTALAQSPHAVDYYIKRSTAYTRSSPAQPALALRDAEVAVVLAHRRQKRELIGQAQLRRAIALFGLERYAEAGHCFGWVRRFAPKEVQTGIWERKLEGKGVVVGEGGEGKVGEGEGNEGEVDVKEIPDVDVEGLGRENARRRKEEEAMAKKKKEEEEDGAQGAVEASTAGASTTTATTTTTQTASAPPPTTTTTTAVQTPPSKIRHDWYQTATTVTVTLLAKGIPKDKAHIDIQPHSLSIAFPLPTGADYDFSLDPLFGAVDPAASSCRILGTKAEFVLAKRVAGQKWAALEGGSGDDGDGVQRTGGLAQAAARGRETAPAYPTSSRSGPKNWDLISQNLTAKKKKAAPSSSDKAAAAAKKRRASPSSRRSSSPSSSSSSRSASPTPASDRSASKASKDPKAANATSNATTTPITDNAKKDDDDDDDDDLEKYNSSEDEAGGDPVNGFFKKLFQNADPDTKRAMMKSYQESNGTSLSTNWSEVGKGKVETTPPDGMVARRWGE